MCGIFGSISLGTCGALYKENQIRGNFASSFTFPKKDTTLWYESCPDFDHIVSEFPKVSPILGHVQSPTSDTREPKRANGHPFRFKGIIVAHNGVLSNFGQLCDEYNKTNLKIDTQIIPRLIHYFKYSDNSTDVVAISKALNLLQGTFGLWIIMNSNIYIARQGSTLFMNRDTGDFSSAQVDGLGISESVPEGKIFQIDHSINEVSEFKDKSPFFIL